MAGDSFDMKYRDPEEDEDKTLEQIYCDPDPITELVSIFAYELNLKFIETICDLGVHLESMGFNAVMQDQNVQKLLSNAKQSISRSTAWFSQMNRAQKALMDTKILDQIKSAQMTPYGRKLMTILSVSFPKMFDRESCFQEHKLNVVS